jgi:NTP pyrophosphatase (non-canonical NTP hydrolase)
MNPKDYVQNALKTESNNFEAIAQRVGAPENIRLLHAAIGLATEAGEIQDQLKKAVFYGKPLDKVNLEEELGDLFWYIAIMSDTLGVSFDQIMEKNIAKLKARYGDKFTEKAALERNLDAEREILEKK